MLNAPRHPKLAMETRSENGLLHHASAWRVYLVGILFGAGAVGILGRIAWVQTHAGQRYVAAISATTTEYEVLPARDGRILTDTLVLATDVSRYDLQLHYRWLESPVSESWLDRQIRSRLTRDEYRDETTRMSVREQLIARREELLKLLASACDVTDEEMGARCSDIQRKVERIADAVNATNRTATSTEHEPSRDEGLLMDAASAVRSALTTPPRRRSETRIVVREEESFHTIASDVEFSVAAQILEQPQRFPGVRTQLRTVRSYPEGSLAAHAVGARTKLREGEQGGHPELDGRLQSRPDERRGRFGVEYSYESALKGKFGLRRIVRDRRQRVVSSEVVRAPVSGRDIVLTLESRLQRHCEQLLREALGDEPLKLLVPRQDDDEAPAPRHLPAGGSIVVMEAATGRLLAAASAPDFSLSLFAGGSQDDWDRTNADQRRPFISRFTGMALPPGSTFKTLTAMAALESQVVAADSQLFCQGYLDRPTEHRCLIFRSYGSSHGQIGIRNALAQSCNVFFFRSAREMGMATLSDWTTRLGFGGTTGVDLPFEKSGTVPNAVRALRDSDRGLSRSDEREALGLAIGQSRLTVTPMQMARLMAVVANGGWLVTPNIVSVEGIGRSVSELSNPMTTTKRRRVADLSEETLQVIREGLSATVSSPSGTGYSTVRLSDVAIAGKTGTAETAPGKPDHAWFAGYVPAEDPQFVIIVVLEHGGSGGRAAGPVAREVGRAIHELQLLNGGSS